MCCIEHKLPHHSTFHSSFLNAYAKMSMCQSHFIKEENIVYQE